MHTCAALASASGKAGISVIRLSGEDSIQIAEKVFKPASGKSLCDIEPNKTVYGGIFASDGNKIDSGMAVCFHAPHSFTGENTVEISCHGSPVGVGLILSALFEAGAVPAIAGEFTKRAFVNGKLDLTRAEAIGQFIDAESAAALSLSTRQIDGALSKEIKDISDEITLLLASLYAYIDYPDEDMTDIPEHELKARLSALREKMTCLCRSYSTGVAVNEGVNAAIVGKPNTGKSSLLNMLLGFDRAIVTDISGTTRDVVSEKVSIGNILVKLSDTAGIRETEDTVERIGIERSMSALSESALIFAVFDVTDNDFESVSDVSETLVSMKDTKNVVIVLNKCDLCSPEKHREYFEKLGFTHIVEISAKQNKGREKIEKEVSLFYPESCDLENAAILTSARQYTAVKKALSDTERAIDVLEKLTPDVACLDMENALSSLLEADGRQVSEEIVDSIFSHFCVGK